VAGTVQVTDNGGLATVRIGREHGNAINAELIGDLVAAFDEAEQDPDVRGVLLASKGKLFSPGLDLRELIELDRPGLAGFLDRFSEGILRFYCFSKPVVAALRGHTIAGGCVLSLTVDWRVLREGAMVGLNEVRVGVPLPYGVAQILRQSVPATRLEEVALFGRNYSGAEAVAAGLAHEIHEDAGFEEHCLMRLDELAAKDPGAFAFTKRYLRSATVERIRADEARYAGDFLDSWFSPGTQERIQAIVAQLKG